MDRHHIYLLHIWIEEREGEEPSMLIRGVLEEPHTGRRWGFSDMGGLAQRVEQLLREGKEMKDG